MTLTEVVTNYLPWILSAVTVWMTLMAGNKHPKAWAIGLCNQTLWAIWIIVTKNWGLGPMCLALTFVYLRNHFSWNSKSSSA